MRTKIFFIFMVGMLAITGQILAITLADNGKTDYSIVIGNTASPSEQHGAEELQHFLQIITGAYFPILRENDTVDGPVILVGNSPALGKIDDSIDFDSLGDEGFVMKTAGQNLILAGGKLRGSMYGVYTFLEKLGCRWYSSKVSKIPSIAKLTIESMNETQKPAFAYREPFWFDAFDGDWAARNKCNSSSARLDEQRGGKYGYWGGHSFYPLIPPARYSEDHPEYYSIINGERTSLNAQLCLTNFELVRLVSGRLLDVIRRDPDNHVYEFSQNDWGNWCTCEACAAIDAREESQAGSILNFINQVADRTVKVYPEKLIGTFAYSYSEKAPKSIRARDNVCIRLCNIVGCDAHPLTDCPMNTGRFVQNMDAWNLLAKHIIIWDYVTNFAHYMMPFPNWYATWRDIQFFKKNNVIGIFEEGAFQSYASSFEELEAYLQAKNLWDPDLDYRVVLDDFLEGYFHKAAPAIRGYMDFIQDKVTKDNIHFNLYSPPTIALFSPENIAICEAYLDEAEELVKDDTDAAYRVEELRLGFRYVKLAQPVEHVLDGSVYRVSPYAPPYANLRELDEFIRDCKKHNVTYLREGGQLEQSFRTLQTNVSNHQVVTLENSFLRVELIPDFGGRITSIINKKSWRNLCKLPSGQGFGGGYGGGFPSGEDLSYTVDRTPEGQRITMVGNTPQRRTANALRVSRTIFLPDDKKEIEIATTVECLAEITRPMRNSLSLDLFLGKKEDILVGLMTPNRDFKLSQLSLQRNERGRMGGTILRGKDLQSGAWVVLNSAESVGVMDVFNADEVEMCSVAADSATGILRMSLSGIQGTMKPGDKLTLSHKIIPLDDLRDILNNRITSVSDFSQ